MEIPDPGLFFAGRVLCRCCVGVALVERVVSALSHNFSLNAIIYIFTIELPETLGDFGGILHIIWWNLVKSHRFPDSSPF